MSDCGRMTHGDVVLDREADITRLDGERQLVDDPRLLLFSQVREHRK